jgi:hypothetical protein
LEVSEDLLTGALTALCAWRRTKDRVLKLRHLVEQSVDVIPGRRSLAQLASDPVELLGKVSEPVFRLIIAHDLEFSLSRARPA